jgi:coenzyme F420-0:L-glutamate ligase/coenzyme F420-1:gamma-L-glutamate ligase
VTDKLEILPVTGMGDVRPGADLVDLIANAAPWLRDGDILVVTSKIVSKADGRLVDVPTSGPEREAARDEILAAETARPVARRGHTVIVQTHHGFVMASAGIDASNVDRSQLVLLPKDPDASARALRSGLRDRLGLDVAVIISDTMGRPWRTGLVDVALGAAGIDALLDHRGQIDPYGNELHITQMALVDELASAAELVKGKREQVPVAVIRGLRSPASRQEDGPGAAVLVRGADQDLFSLGTAEARQAGLREAGQLHDVTAFGPPGEDAGSARELAAGGAAAAATFAALLGQLPVPPGVRCDPRPAPDRSGLPPFTRHAVMCTVDDPADVAAQLALGTWLHRLRCLLAAEDLATITIPAGVGSVVLAAGARPEQTWVR